MDALRHTWLAGPGGRTPSRSHTCYAVCMKQTLHVGGSSASWTGCLGSCNGLEISYFYRKLIQLIQHNQNNGQLSPPQHFSLPRVGSGHEIRYGTVICTLSYLKSQNAMIS